MDSNRISHDLSAASFEGKLARLLKHGFERSRRERHPVLVSLSLPIQTDSHLAIFAATAGVCRDRLLWSQPDAGFSLAGFGAAQVIETHGPRRFSETGEAWRELCAEALIEAGESSCGPVLLGGFSFDTARGETSAWRGYPDGRMVLPRACLCTRKGRSYIVVNAVLKSDTTPEREQAEIFNMLGFLRAELRHAPQPLEGEKPVLSELRPASGWRDEVSAAVRAVRRGDLGKVVLARAVRLDAPHPFDAAVALQRLGAGYPTCVVFAVARDDRCFVGATPERLLRVRDGQVSTMCLAGSYPRAATEEADQKMGEALLADPKERKEHGLVLGALIQTLRACCSEVNVPDGPAVLKLSNVQHLCTPLSGRISPGRGIFEIVEQLHPTPSVGGQPRELALRFIREHEGLDRGWYAGALGWADHRGEGEFAVAIRAALLCGAQATLFAGCGIVGDSDPDREYAESCMKLTPMLTALGAV